ncbi:MAG: hypothetical protein ABIQ40_16285 [Bacteroidia bacterium]
MSLKLICILSFVLFVEFKINAQFNFLPFPIGDSLLTSGDLAGAIKEYKKDYELNPQRHLAANNLAVAFSIDRQIDSAFKYLFISLAVDTTLRPLGDPNFIPLWKDDRWQQFEARMFDEVFVDHPNILTDIPLNFPMERQTHACPSVMNQTLENYLY